ncbi:titin homolog isoform X1 [Colias croceus]|uniref:titin homolog isoform X1 n=1 Tax=Colias crocea TaxID=72248 RepID=UPI001E27DD73|nr:titin homolog isoform X1 [Colias croceus]XP_045503111.1 titin homolog isoform X1 [Colias croceus]
MPIGNVSKDSGPKRESFRPPWVKDKDSEAPPPWLQKKLKPVDSPKLALPAQEEFTIKPIKPLLKKQATIRAEPTNGSSETLEENLVKPSAAKQADKASRPVGEKPRFTKSSLKSTEKSTDDKPSPSKPVQKVSIVDKVKPDDKPVAKVSKPEDKTATAKVPEKPILKSVKTIDDKAKEKSVSIVDRKSDKNETAKQNTSNDVTLNGKAIPNSLIKENKLNEKPTEKVKKEDKSNMATKPPTPIEKSPSKLPPRKPLQKAPSKDDVMLKKWRDPLHERVKENIDKTLANEIPKGHTLTKNESLRSLLKPTPPPPPPPAPPKLPPPPDFKKPQIDPNKLKKIEQLRSRPRRRPDWSDMMKEVEQGRKLKHVVCNDRSSPIITTSVVVKNKGQFIFESEQPNSHNELLKEISKGVRLKKVKCNDRSKPNLEGLRKFRRQMTIEEQVQKSMSQANLAAPGAAVAEVPAAEEEEIDEMDDIDRVRDDLQSTKQLLAIELRNKEAQERENKRLLTRIQNLEAELARERAFIKQEQHKTVISVTDAYDERLVNSLKLEVEKAKETADSLQKQYLQAAEDRDDALTELEEVKRKNSELEKKLEQALSYFEEFANSGDSLSVNQKNWLDFIKQCKSSNIDITSPEAEELKKKIIANNNASAYTNNCQEDEGIMPTNVGSRRSSHAIKQLSVTKDDSFEEEEESDDEEEESEEKKQKRLEKEVRNMRNKIRHLKEKQDNMKRERMAYKMSLKNTQAALKNEKKKYKELKREVDKMAAMMKEVGSDEDEDEEVEEEESEDEKKSGSEEEETETETEQDTESETESESEPEDAPLPKKKDNLTQRLKRHETRVNALKKGNTLLMANVDRLKDDVLKQKEMSLTLQKELDSLIDDLE